MEWPLLAEVSDHELRLELARRSDEDRLDPRQVGSYRSRWEAGSGNSRGTVGAPGPLINGLDTQGRLLIVVSSTLEIGSTDYLGRGWAILSPSSEGREGACILMASFDSETASSLNEHLSSKAGSPGTVETASFRMTMREEPCGTSRST